MIRQKLLFLSHTHHENKHKQALEKIILHVTESMDKIDYDYKDFEICFFNLRL